ncbi:hypothetical protein [Bdellovibrio sp. HCB2-146]|uniref:hypothetical protein n=1 Tax=Bdellovibrio sp. HCB2-146 TaxID=3394362 RepID=UPI0039BC85E3
MDLKNRRNQFKSFKGFVLAIIFTLVGLNCQASANQCSDLFSTAYSSTWIANLEKASPEAQKFWRDTGKQFQETLQRDLDHHQDVYKEAKDARHPTIAFLLKLGFGFKGGRLVVPDFFFMMKNLDLMRQSASLPVELKFLWTLKHKQYGLEQALTLDPFQDFQASNMVYETRSSLLPVEAFGKLIANGIFPIGGLESATNTTRFDFDRFKKGSILSDFLHDLSHVQSFIENPDFASVHQNAYKAREIRWAQMEKKIGPDSTRNYRRRDEGGLTLFIFSESSWGFHSRYKEVVEQTPLVHKLSTEQTFISGSILKLLSSEDQALLKTDLQALEKNWWKIVSSYGGASMDLITYGQFAETKYQLPMNAVLTALKNVNSRTAEWDNRDFNDAALVLRFLKEAPNFSSKSWEYFAITKDVKKSKVYQAMRRIFEGHQGSDMQGFSLLAHYLGIRDTSQN